MTFSIPAQEQLCSAPVDPDDPQIWDWGFRRVINVADQPAVGASILALGIFFFIAFVSRAILAQTSLGAMGYALTFTAFAFLALVIIILFVI